MLSQQGTELSISSSDPSSFPASAIRDLLSSLLGLWAWNSLAQPPYPLWQEKPLSSPSLPAGEQRWVVRTLQKGLGSSQLLALPPTLSVAI